MMNLQRFRVRKFRSVEDSGWIKTEQVTTLIGINEAGKSNVLIALWKLNPAREGKIDLLTDLPRSLYSSLRDAEEKPDFIEAEFLLDEDQASTVAQMSSKTTDEIRRAVVKRNYDESYSVEFPDAEVVDELPAEEVRSILEKVLSDLKSLEVKGKAVEGITKEQATEAVKLST